MCRTLACAALLRACQSAFFPVTIAMSPDRHVELRVQGMGRQPFNYVKARMREELQACDLLLEKSGAFLTGDSPVQADCFLFAFMEQVCASLPGS